MKTTMLPDARWSRATEMACALAACTVLVGCASSTHQAPVEDRVPRVLNTGGPTLGVPVGPSAAPAGVAGPASAPASVPIAPSAPSVAMPAPAAPASSPEPARTGAEFAGQPGYYTVKAGDTLLRIGLETGQNWRDLARWNNIENPNVLEVGAVLRVVPPASEVGAATARPVAPSPRIESRPLDGRPAASTPGTGGASPAASVPGSPASPPVPVAPAATTPGTAAPPAPSAPVPPPAPRDAEGDISWAWPASGPVTTPFDDVRSKGVSIAGKAGDPVLAAADGRVVYAGSGLRGYGNLVIVKHNATFLTAYAHNQTLLVKEDQVVRRGQKIAEMGSSDTDRVQLHFEVRRLGKPVDPTRVLPPR